MSFVNPDDQRHKDDQNTLDEKSSSASLDNCADAIDIDAPFPIHATTTSTKLDDASCRKVGVAKIQSDDVLLGRGAFAVNFLGNLRFRDLVQQRKEDNIHATPRARKEKIALDILKVIQDKKGRFLQPIESEVESAAVDKDSTWIIAEEAVALEKIKQALRKRDRSMSSRIKETKTSAPTSRKIRSRTVHKPLNQTDGAAATAPSPEVEPFVTMDCSLVTATKRPSLSTPMPGAPQILLNFPSHFPPLEYQQHQPAARASTIIALEQSRLRQLLIQDLYNQQLFIQDQYNQQLMEQQRQQLRDDKLVRLLQRQQQEDLQRSTTLSLLFQSPTTSPLEMFQQHHHQPFLPQLTAVRVNQQLQPIIPQLAAAVGVQQLDDEAQFMLSRYYAASGV